MYNILLHNNQNKAKKNIIAEKKVNSVKKI